MAKQKGNEKLFQLINQINMKSSKAYDVISPDGFSIHPTDTYSSLKKAVKAFKEWKKRYKIQGYYSSVNFGRIHLDDLEDFVEFKKINLS